jgi:hypothetical protein
MKMTINLSRAVTTAELEENQVFAAAKYSNHY